MKDLSRLFFGRIFLIILCLTFATPGYSDKIKSALKQLNKGEYAKAKKLLDKSLSKEQVNPGAKYVYSLYYNTQDKEFFSLDSSYRYILSAIDDFNSIDQKDKKKLNKVNINDSSLANQKAIIERLAYTEASRLNTEESYTTFIAKFPTAAQVPEAIRIRDEIAFENAKKINTAKSYNEFLNKYPSSALKEQAQENYDLKLFEEATGAGTLNEFITFLRNNPTSPYRTKAEEKVYKISTVLNSKEKYIEFVKNFQGSSFKNEALSQLLFHYLEENQLDAFIEDYPDVSVVGRARVYQQRRDSVYFVFYGNSQFGFINELGGALTETRFDGVPEDYLCSGVQDEIILFAQDGKLGAIDKAGVAVLPAEFDEIEKIGTGFLKVRDSSSVTIYSMTGKKVLKESFVEIVPLSNSFVKVKSNGQWGVRSINGTEAISPSLDEIRFWENDFFIIRKNEKFGVVTSSDLVGFSESGKSHLQFAFDDVEEVDENFLEVTQNGKVGVLDKNLKYVIPVEYNSITFGKKIWLAKKDEGIELLNKTGQLLNPKPFQQIKKGNSVYAVKQNDKWGFIDESGKELYPLENDSVSLIGNKIALITKDGQTSVLFDFKKVVPLAEYKNLEVLSAGKNLNDSIGKQFLLIEDKRGKMIIYNQKGIPFLKNTYDKITALSNNLFVVEERGKTGIVDSTGKIKLPLRYNAIGNYDGTYVSILQNSKFGIFAPKNKIFIQPKYDALLKVFDPVSKIFLAFDKGAYAFVDEKGKLMSEHKFKEVELWNNDTVLVKEGSEQYLYSIKAKQKVSDSFESIKFLKNTPEEKLAIAYKNSAYGVLHNKKGFLIPLKYNDVTNLGSIDRPFYMAEHHVEEADLYVVLYINHTGKIVMTQAYKSDDYDKLLCQE